MEFSFLNALAKCDALLKPQSSAIRSIDSVVDTKSRFDCFKRYKSKYSCGVTSKQRRKYLIRFDGLISDKFASSSIEIGSSKCFAMYSSVGRSNSLIVTALSAASAAKIPSILCETTGSLTIGLAAAEIIS